MKYQSNDFLSFENYITNITYILLKLDPDFIIYNSVRLKSWMKCLSIIVSNDIHSQNIIYKEELDHSDFNIEKSDNGYLVTFSQRINNSCMYEIMSYLYRNNMSLNRKIIMLQYFEYFM